MSSQPVSSIILCSPLPSWTWRTLDLSISWCLPTSFFVCLVFFNLSLCLARWLWPDLMNGRLVHIISVCVSLRWSGSLRVIALSLCPKKAPQKSAEGTACTGGNQSSVMAAGGLRPRKLALIMRKWVCKFDAERLKASKGRTQEADTASNLSMQSPSAEVFACPKCSRICVSRIWLYSHHRESETWLWTFSKILSERNLAIFIIINGYLACFLVIAYFFIIIKEAETTKNKSLSVPATTMMQSFLCSSRIVFSADL